MVGMLDQDGGDRLEGLCGGRPGRIRLAPACEGIERFGARFRGRAFAPHRHDTYGIGITLSGVQTFGYRGEQRACLPGQCHLLHPDEVHDGAAGTDEGFSYRIAYVDPSLIQEALGGRALPFVGDPVIDSGAFGAGPLSALWRLDQPVDEVERIEIVAALADGLRRLSGARDMAGGPLRLAALRRVRDLIADAPAAPLSVGRLEQVSGLDRWALARQFRAAFGTSPTRFRTMRQLDLARRAIAGGAALAEAALQAGFSDQSHLSRMFKRAYGLTPARWAALVREAAR